ncbi:hypothetical protein Tco_0873531 [Tanacetum coccineum]|uniref:Uncharacterized protein n=1 Tax=Tanacetum coccineum TaxID=301880 RepID=A0ABQ5BJ59_9ASTR
MSNNQDRDLVLRRKKEKSLDYNNSFLGEYECSSLALDREERIDEKEEIGSLKTRSNNAVPDISGGRRRLTLPFLSFSGEDFIWFSRKFEGGFEQDIDDEDEEDKEDEEGDGEV